MPTIKISKSSIKRGGGGDWKKEYLLRKENVLKTAKKTLSKTFRKTLKNKQGGAIVPSVNQSNVVEPSLSAGSYSLQSSLGTVTNSMKSTIWSIQGKVTTFMKIIIFILIFVIIYLFGYVVYQKYVVKDEKYKGASFVVSLKTALQDFIKNLKQVIYSVGKLFGITKKGSTTPLEEDDAPQQNEVFHIGKNEFTYKQSKQACSALGARLATRSEVQGAYNKGAGWCNYGWTDGQYALYPTQKKTYRMLKRAGRSGECGKPGINGGYFADAELEFGVNCYGMRPQTENSNIMNVDCANPKVIQKIDKLTGKYALEYKCPSIKGKRRGGGFDLSDIQIMPFSNYQWSKTSDNNDLYIGNNTIIRNTNDQLESGISPYSSKRDDEKYNNILKSDLKNALKEFHAKLTEDKFLSDLRISLKSYIDNGDNDQIYDGIVTKLLMMEITIYSKHNIDSSPNDSDKKIKGAIAHFNDRMINNYHAEIYKIVSPSGIQDIMDKLKA